MRSHSTTNPPAGKPPPGVNVEPSANPGPGKKQRKKHTVKTVLTAAAAAAVTAVGVFGPHLSSTPNMDVFAGCGLTGIVTTAQQAKLNPLKNRYTFPTTEDIVPKVDLALMLKSTKGQLDDSKAAEIEGFITEVRAGGIESCNCGATDPINMDTHIYVNETPDGDKKHAVIVEITPRMRKLMEGKADWSTKSLVKLLKPGTKVRLTGWLFYDSEHENAAQNIKDRPHNWRGTCWELHPVTGIEMENAEQPSVPSPPG
jgi:hypothetical protein